MSDTSTLIAIKYKGQMIDLPTGGGSTDLSNYYTKTQIDTSIASNYASKNDVSIYLTENDVSTFAKITYISQSDYDNLSVKDPNTLYLIV